MPSSGSESTSLSSTDPTSSISGPEGAPHTSPGCNPGNPPGKTNLRSEGTPHSRGPRISTTPSGFIPFWSLPSSPFKSQVSSFCFLISSRPSLCGVPSEHTYSLEYGSQGDALGWYALPRWGKKSRPWGKKESGHSLLLPAKRTHEWVSAIGSWGSVLIVVRQSRANRTPRFRFHALRGHRIPAQGANPGNAPEKTNLRSEGTPHSRRPRISTPPSGFIPFWSLPSSPFKSQVSSFCFLLSSLLSPPSLCGVPSEHTYSLGCGS